MQVSAAQRTTEAASDHQLLSKAIGKFGKLVFRRIGKFNLGIRGPSNLRMEIRILVHVMSVPFLHIVALIICFPPIPYIKLLDNFDCEHACIHSMFTVTKSYDMQHTYIDTYKARNTFYTLCHSMI